MKVQASIVKHFFLRNDCKNYCYRPKHNKLLSNVFKLNMYGNWQLLNWLNNEI